MKRLVLRAKLTEIRCIYFELTSSFQSFFGNNILYCESWTVKKVKRQRIDAFELWCWRRLLKVPLTERRSNQSILREINPECPFEGLCWSWSSSILVIWFEQPTHWKSPWCWEGSRTEVEEDISGSDAWTATLMQGTWTWTNFRRWWRIGRSGMLQSMGLQRLGHDWTTEKQKQYY